MCFTGLSSQPPAAAAGSLAHGPCALEYYKYTNVYTLHVSYPIFLPQVTPYCLLSSLYIVSSLLCESLLLFSSYFLLSSVLFLSSSVPAYLLLSSCTFTLFCARQTGQWQSVPRPPHQTLPWAYCLCRPGSRKASCTE